ncbi:MAG: hypothetical protein CSYNP_03901 [Syntrophus sp. SKADARSKE-3]|nr:hypothetical protein [Syntrophus sp. SKADARSKE-3]
MRKPTVTFVVLLIVIMIYPLPAFSAPVGKITALEGNVDITVGTSPAKPLVMGDPVSDGNILRVKSKSKAEITFLDGNILRLAENTRLRVTHYRPDTEKASHVNLFRGKVQAFINKLGRGSTFEIKTPTAVCGVRGTIFIGYFQNGQSGFIFTHGSGYGYNINTPKEILLIPVKNMMIVSRPDQRPILRILSDTEIDKHVKDTTPSGKPGDSKDKERKDDKNTSDSATKTGETAKKDEGKKDAKAGEDSSGKPTGTGSGTAATPTSSSSSSGTTTPSATTTSESTSGTSSAATTSTSSTATTASTITQASVSASGTSSVTTPFTSSTTTTTLDSTQYASSSSVTAQQTPTTVPPTTVPIITVPIMPQIPIDTTPPTISLVSGPDSLSKTTQATFTYTANETVTYQYRLDNGAWQSGQAAVQNGTTTLSNLTEGQHTLDIKATDTAGNASTQSYTWTTDSMPPATTFVSKPSTLTNKTTADFSFSFSEKANYQYRLDNGAWQTGAAGALSGAATLSNLTEGEHTLDVKAVDAAGNASTQSYTWTTAYMPPTINFTSTPISLTNKNTASFGFNFNEKADYSYRLDNGAWQAGAAAALSGAATLSNLSEGQHTLDVKAMNATGKASTQSYTWTTDYTPPTINLTSTPMTLNNKNTANFGFTFNEKADYSYRLDNRAWQTGAAAALSGAATLSNLTEGQHTLDIKATDIAGNASTQSYTWKTDYAPPTINFTSAPTTVTNKNTASFGFSFSEKAAYQYRLDNGNWQTGQTDTLNGTTTLTNLASGQHTFDLMATDDAGNTTTTTFTWTTNLVVPVVLPIVTISSSQATPADTGKATITMNLASTKAGTTFQYMLDQTAYQATGASLSITGLPSGSHTITVVGTDTDGNKSDPYSLSFNLNNYDGPGKLFSTAGLGIANVQSQISSITGQDWGGWKTAMSGTGTPNSSWTAYYGNADSTHGMYFIGQVSGTAANGILSGQSSKFAYMSGSLLGLNTQSGTLTGSYSGGSWQATDSGTGILKESALKYASLIGLWNADGTQAGARLQYMKKQDYTPVSTISITGPITISVTGNTSPAPFSSGAWISPSHTGWGGVLLFPSVNWGLQTWSKSLYPYAVLYYSPDANTQNIYMSRFNPGTSFFSVHNNLSGTGNYVNATVKILDGSGNAIAGTTITKQFTDNFWNTYLITAPDDPAAPATLSILDATGATSSHSITAVSDATITGVMGGTNTLVTGTGDLTNVPLRFMGTYTYDTVQALKINRYWLQPLIAYNQKFSRYVSLENVGNNPGTYFGVLGGTLMESNQTVEGRIAAYYINESGNVGLLRGSFGANGTQQGVLYPQLISATQGMWDADGSVNRTDMNTSYLIPANLTGQWWRVDPPPAVTDPKMQGWMATGVSGYISRSHATTYQQDLLEWKNTKFYFADNNFENRQYSTWRNDYFDTYLLRDPNNLASFLHFGVWSWLAEGNYTTLGTQRWLLTAAPEIRSPANYTYWRENAFAYGSGGWSNGRISGRAFATSGSGIMGGTNIRAGDAVGTYNDDTTATEAGYQFKTFGITTTGSWIETKTYLNMIDGGKSNQLDALGFPTSVAATVPTMPGTLAIDPTKAAVVSDFRIVNLPDLDILKLWAARSITISSPMTQGAAYPITGASGSESTQPLYGVLGIVFKYTDPTQPSTWLGNFDGLGVFNLTLNGASTLKQGGFYGSAAGTYTAGGFTGTGAGLWYESTFLTPLSDANRSTALLYFDGASFQSDGILKGLLGSATPLDSVIYPLPTGLQIRGAGIWQGGSNTALSHVFQTTIYPYNYIDNTYTTSATDPTQKASFWGNLIGIHQKTSYIQDGLEARLCAFFVDKSGNLGVMRGQLGGPEAWQTGSYYGFDINSLSFRTATLDESPFTLISFGTTATVNASSLYNAIIAGPSYCYKGGLIPAPAGPDTIGQFYSTTTGLTEYMSLSSLTNNITTSTINDANVNGKLNLWTTIFGGTTSNPTTFNPTTANHWMGEWATTATDTSGQMAGMTVWGEQWRDNRISGTIGGYWANIADVTTGLMFGRLLGTYDPAQSYRFQAVAAGIGLETTKFLQLASSQAGREQLAKVQIPCVEVGNATLSGTDGNVSVTMENMRFFANSTGQRPPVWAVGGQNLNGQPNLRGSYSSTAPTSGTNISLAGNGLTANFTFNSWNASSNNKWAATVNNGAGSITGGGTNVSNLNFRGAAAGTISSNTFSGTAAGVAK